MYSKFAFFSIVVLAFCLMPFAQEDLFNNWDINRDGQMTLDEFPGGQSQAQYFYEMDMNQDNIVTRDEFNAYMGIQAPAPKPKKKNRRQLKKEIQKLQEKIRALQSENQRLKSRPRYGYQNQSAVNKLKAENQKLAKQISHLKSQNHNLTKNINNLNEKLKNVNNQRTNLQRQINKLKRTQQSNNNIWQATAKLKQQINILQKQLATKDSTIQNLQNQIVSLKRQNQSHNQVITKKPQEYKKKEQQIKVQVAANYLMAEEMAYQDALRQLASNIRGSWIASCSRNVNGQNELLIAREIDKTTLTGVIRLAPKVLFFKGYVTYPVEITRAQIIRSIEKNQAQKMSQEEYMDLKYMFPDKILATGYAAFTPKGKKQIVALHGARADAERKLVEQLKGVMVKSSTRMKNFAVTHHEVFSSIETTLLIGVKVSNREIVGSGTVAQTTVKISKAMFIYSIRQGLENNGMKLTPDEYQELNNMLDKRSYEFVGKAVIK